jgi:hypothetical protein
VKWIQCTIEIMRLKLFATICARSLIMVDKLDQQYWFVFDNYNKTILFLCTSINIMHLETSQPYLQTYTKQNTLRFFIFYKFRANNLLFTIFFMKFNWDPSICSQKTQYIQCGTQVLSTINTSPKSLTCTQATSCLSSKLCNYFGIYLLFKKSILGYMELKPI